mmetsp:Transcript_8217/g.23633  ORF Transcript_8217/g.23633 Transcript_8217/m.23633 type:complete len:259 (-) Transcript_8217:369-1145(-)
MKDEMVMCRTITIYAIMVGCACASQFLLSGVFITVRSQGWCWRDSSDLAGHVLWRVPGGEQRRPRHAGDQDDVELVPNRHESEVEQLHGDPERPLRLLRLPQDVRYSVLDVRRAHALHRAHGAVVHGVGNPAPVHELLHEGLEDGNLQPRHVGAHRHPLQKVEMDVRRRRVDGKAKQHRPRRAHPIVLRLDHLPVVRVAAVSGDFGNRLGDAVAESPQERARHHLRQHGHPIQVSLVHLQQRERSRGCRSRLGLERGG